MIRTDWPSRFRWKPPGGMGSSILVPFGWLFEMAVRLRRLLYRSGFFQVWRAPVPVVSVGNLAVGGTGKTPLVDLLASRLLTRGIRVAVVSHGYGGSGGKGVGVVCRGEGPELGPDVCGDEPCLLARRNPKAVVLVARRRKEAVMAAASGFGADVILLDDGFQHLALKRDLDIVLLDGRHPFGNGRLLPAGPLREPPAAISRADCLLFTRCPDNFVPPAGDRFRGKDVFLSRHRIGSEAFALDGGRKPLADLRGRKGLAFAGIADPEDFFRKLLAEGLDLAETVALPDHAVYDEAVLDFLVRSGNEAEFFLTTEKDGIKLAPGVFSKPCYQIPMVLEIDGFRGLEERVLSLLPRLEKI